MLWTQRIKKIEQIKLDLTAHCRSRFLLSPPEHMRQCWQVRNHVLVAALVTGDIDEPVDLQAVFTSLKHVKAQNGSSMQKQCSTSVMASCKHRKRKRTAISGHKHCSFQSTNVSVPHTLATKKLFSIVCWDNLYDCFLTRHLYSYCDIPNPNIYIFKFQRCVSLILSTVVPVLIPSCNSPWSV